MSTGWRVVHRSVRAGAGGGVAGQAGRMTIFQSVSQQISRRAKAIRRRIERGMTTAEYAVGTVAAVAFAAVLYKIVRSDAVSSALTSIVTSALHAL